MKTEIKIIVTDDKERFRNAIISLLESNNIACIGEAENGIELLALLETTQPDIVLLDLEMPLMDGNESLDRIFQLYPEMKIIIVSFHDGQEVIDNYIARGAKGYVIKDVISKRDTLPLVDAILKVYDGGIYVSPQITKSKSTEIFTPVEKYICQLLCDGLTQKEIATLLNVGERTIERHKQKMLEKTKSENTAQFFKYLYMNGIHLLSKAK